MNKTVRKNAAKSVWIFFIVVILVIILGLIVTALVFKNPDVTPSAFGYSAFIMDEDGMGDSVPKGALIIAKNYSPSSDNLGDAILCEEVKGHGTTVIRLSNIVPNTKTVIYQGFYDNDREKIYDIPSSKLIGKAVSYNMVLGKIISFVTSYKGRAVLIVVPILMLLVCEGIIGIYSKNAKQSRKKEKFRRKMESYKIPENSPLNPEKINSHSGPITIEDYIFGAEESQKPASARKGKELSSSPEAAKRRQAKSPSAETVEFKKDRPVVRKPNGANREAAQRSGQPQRSQQPPRKPRPVDSRRQPVKSGEGVPERKPARPPQKDGLKDMVREDTAVVSTAPAEEKVRQGGELQRTVQENIPAESTKPAAPAAAPVQEKPIDDEVSNQSLARLIKLMEEQEKLLKEKSQID